MVRCLAAVKVLGGQLLEAPCHPSRLGHTPALASKRSSKSEPVRTALSHEPTLPMRAVSRRTGLTADTLRVWERRHGVVVPSRTDGNARRYSEADVQRLLALRDAVAQGRNISDLARLSEEDLAEVSSAEPPRSDAAGLVARYLEALHRYDVAAAQELLSRCALLAPRALVLEIALPILSAIGDGWASERVSIGEEHIASIQLRNLLSSATNVLRAPSDAEGVLFAAPSGHQHELGVAMAATLALAHGVRPIVMGADTPIEQVVRAARGSHARLAVLGISRRMDRKERETLRSDLEQVPATLEIWIGGVEPASSFPERVRVFPSLEDFEHAMALRAGPRR